jgi:hypothetical protein
MDLDRLQAAAGPLMEAIETLVVIFALVFGLRWMVIGLKEYWNEKEYRDE